MLTAMLAAVALLADTTPAAAAAAAQPAAKPAPKAQGSDIVCHKEYQLGSNIPTKVCRSRSEDEANRAESRMNLEHMQAQSAPPNGH